MAIKTIQLLRNSTLFTTRALAISGLETQFTSAKDGQPILARYTGGDNKEHTLLGIKSAKGYEIFDNEGTSADIQAAIAALDAEVTSTGGKNVQVKVTEADGKITGVSVTTDNTINATDLSNAINALDSSVSATAAVGNAYSVLTGVTQADGVLTGKTEVKLAAAAKTGAAADVSIADSGDKFTSTNVEGALAELASKVNANEITNADGSITVTPANGTTTDVKVHIKDGEQVIKLDDKEGGIYTDLSIKTVSSSETNVKEAWGLFSSNVQLGSTIKIYKDSSLHSVYLGHVDDGVTSPTDPTVVPGTGDAALCFIYQKADGTYKLVAVNVESFLEESEFKNGLQVVNHEVSVKIDDSSESVTTASGVTSPVLSVSTNGVKVDNIQGAINYAVSTATDGLDYADTAVSHQFVTEVDETNGVISVQRAQPTASDIATTAITADTTHVAIAGTDAATQIGNISKAIKAEETARANAIAGLDATVTSTNGTNVNVTVTEVDGKITGVSVADNSINATNLSNAINALDSSVSATAASGNVYSVLTGVTQADGKLKGKTEVTLAAAAKTGAAADVSIADSGQFFTATNVEAALAELATFDCGEY